MCVATDLLLRGHQASCAEIGAIVLDEWGFACTIIMFETALAFERSPTSSVPKSPRSQRLRTGLATRLP